mmetsp:Transcript_12105/g.20819  ORF Transcript_12105/g.20819 Transcript_12105/m.20819 type:complete len:1001 (-) Transcript_12105:159-3161(-)
MSMFGGGQHVKPPGTSDSGVTPDAISQLRSDVLSLERRFLQRIDDEAQRTSQRIEAELQRSIAQVRADVSVVQAQMDRDRLAVSGVESTNQQLRTELPTQKDLNDQTAATSKMMEDLRKDLIALQSELPQVREQSGRMSSDLHRNFQEVTDTVAMQSDHLSKVDTICRELASRNDDLDRKIKEIQQDQLAEIVALRARLETSEEERHGLLGKVNKFQTMIQEEEGKRVADISAMNIRLAQAESLLGSNMASSNSQTDNVSSEIESLRVRMEVAASQSESLRARMEAVETSAGNAAALARDTQISDQTMVLTTRLESTERQVTAGQDTQQVMASRIEALDRGLANRMEAVERSLGGLGTPASLLTRIGAIEHQVQTAASPMGAQLARIDALEKQMAQALQLASGGGAGANAAAASVAATQQVMLEQTTELSKMRTELERVQQELAQRSIEAERGQPPVSMDDIRGTLDLGIKRVAVELGQSFRNETASQISDAALKLRTEFRDEITSKITSIESRANLQQESFQTELRQVAAAFGAYIKKAESSQSEKHEAVQLVPRVARVEDEVGKATRLLSHVATTILEERQMKQVTKSNLEAIEADMRDMLGGTANTATTKSQSDDASTPRGMDSQKHQLAQLLLDLGSSRVPSVSAGDNVSLQSEPNLASSPMSQWRPENTMGDPSSTAAVSGDDILSDGLKESLEDLVSAVERTLLSKSPAEVVARQPSSRFPQPQPRTISPDHQRGGVGTNRLHSTGGFTSRTKSPIGGHSNTSPPSSLGPSARRGSSHLGKQGPVSGQSTRAASYGYPSSDSVDNSRGGVDLSINRTRMASIGGQAGGSTSLPVYQPKPGSMRLPQGGLDPAEGSIMLEAHSGSLRLPPGGLPSQGASMRLSPGNSASIGIEEEEAARPDAAMRMPPTSPMMTGKQISITGQQLQPNAARQLNSAATVVPPGGAMRPGSITAGQRVSQRSPVREPLTPGANPVSTSPVQTNRAQLPVNLTRMQR